MASLTISFSRKYLSIRTLLSNYTKMNWLNKDGRYPAVFINYLYVSCQEKVVYIKMYIGLLKLYVISVLKCFLKKKYSISHFRSYPVVFYLGKGKITFGRLSFQTVGHSALHTPPPCNGVDPRINKKICFSSKYSLTLAE